MIPPAPGDRRIGVTPRVPLLGGGRAADLSSWPGHAARTWLALGRAAIHEAFLSLPGTDRRSAPGTAWFPAFHCGVEVQAGIDAGYRPRFYRIVPAAVGATGAPGGRHPGREAGAPGADVGHLRDGLRVDPGPVLLTHFFGLPDPGVADVASACDEAGVPLIEDLSHALFARQLGRPVGTFGVAAGASLRKVLGTPGGGWLAVDPGLVGLAPEMELRAPPLRGPELAWVARKLGARTPAAWDPPDDATSPSHSGSWARRRIAPFSLRRAGALSPPHIRDGRRANWSRLNQALADVPGFDPLPRELPEGASPLVFVLQVRDRRGFLGALDRAGVDAYVFGARPHPALDVSAFPEARDLREGLVGLPVHHGLDEGELGRVASAVRGALRAMGEGG